MKRHHSEEIILELNEREVSLAKKGREATVRLFDILVRPGYPSIVAGKNAVAIQPNRQETSMDTQTGLKRPVFFREADLHFRSLSSGHRSTSQGALSKLPLGEDRDRHACRRLLLAFERRYGYSFMRKPSTSSHIAA